MNIVVAGDFCPRNRVARLFDNGEYKMVLGGIKDIISDADYSIVNFECPITHNNEKPIIKSGGNLCCSETGMHAVKWAGFDCVTLANNHFRDYGDNGVKNTILACKNINIDLVGGGMTIGEASKTLYKKIKGRTLAIINCCEHEFSIATETKAGCNPLNPISQFYAIQEARKRANYVLVIVHGGHELWQLPSPRMKETYRFFIDAGADAVVNHHQHCYSGYEIYKNKPIFYGLGNFCFDNTKRKGTLWETGYFVTLNLGEQISFDVVPYRQCDKSPSVSLLLGDDLDGFKYDILELNRIIADDKKLHQQFEYYLQQRSLSLRGVLTPYRNKYLSFLHCKGLLPSFYPRRKYLLLREMFTCESHYDSFLYYIDKQIEKL